MNLSSPKPLTCERENLKRIKTKPKVKKNAFVYLQNSFKRLGIEVFPQNLMKQRR